MFSLHRSKPLLGCGQPRSIAITLRGIGFGDEATLRLQARHQRGKPFVNRTDTLIERFEPRTPVNCQLPGDCRVFGNKEFAVALQIGDSGRLARPADRDASRRRVDQTHGLVRQLTGRDIAG